MGLLYGGNTAGAVFGCLLAGFYLLRVTDMTVATFVAVALNVRGGVWSSLRAGHASAAGGGPHAADASRRRSQGYWPVYVTIATFGRHARWAPKWSGRACWA